VPYQIRVSEEAKEFLIALDTKSKSICKNNLQKLSEPYPGRGVGDKERLIIAGKDRYRLHIGRTYTAFYTINEEKQLVQIVEILTIKAAHKKYGY
jgi:mRNA-degrading endonuclease RelE of RelBE toxin-antitoxin system